MLWLYISLNYFIASKFCNFWIFLFIFWNFENFLNVKSRYLIIYYYFFLICLDLLWSLLWKGQLHFIILINTGCTKAALSSGSLLERGGVQREASPLSCKCWHVNWLEIPWSRVCLSVGVATQPAYLGAAKAGRRKRLKRRMSHSCFPRPQADHWTN